MRTLFLSGYSSHAALPESVTADPGAFLQKPFTVEALLSKVRERLARSSGRVVPNADRPSNDPAG